MINKICFFFCRGLEFGGGDMGRGVDYMGRLC